MKKWKLILCVVLALLIIPVGISVIYINFILDKVSVDDTEFDKEFDLDINSNLNNKDIRNIALFGVDCRTTDYNGCRSDVVMIISYDKGENNVLLTSVARDTYVEISNHGFDKINHAYAFGGPELAIQTLNRNFDLNIEEYITVDFWAVEKIINAIGGVDIEVGSDELVYLNQTIDSLNEYADDGVKVDNVYSAGLQSLNGRQAVGYMRVRKIGDGDFERMQRQRQVMAAALEKVKSISLPNLLVLSNDLVSTIRTNLAKDEIINLLTTVTVKGIPSMKQFQLPTREFGVGTKIDSIYYFVPQTLLDNVIQFHDLINWGSEYEPSQSVIEISNEIEKHIN